MMVHTFCSFDCSENEQVTCLHMALTHGGAALTTCRRAVELAFEAVGGGGNAESLEREDGGWGRVSVKVGAWQLGLPDGKKNEEEEEDEEEEEEDEMGVCLVTEELVADGGNESAECSLVFGASFRVCKENVFGLSLNLKVFNHPPSDICQHQWLASFELFRPPSSPPSPPKMHEGGIFIVFDEW